MAYLKNNTLIARPVVDQVLGDFSDTIRSGATRLIDFFGAGIKAQGAQEALAAQQAAQLAAQQAGRPYAYEEPGISTTTLVVGGVAVAGLLVFLMTRKKK